MLKYFSHLRKSKRKIPSLGLEVGLEVIDNDKVGAEEDQSEEDREVQKIVDQGRVMKRKMITGKA